MGQVVAFIRALGERRNRRQGQSTTTATRLLTVKDSYGHSYSGGGNFVTVVMVRASKLLTELHSGARVDF